MDGQRLYVVGNLSHGSITPLCRPVSQFKAGRRRRAASFEGQELSFPQKMPRGTRLEFWSAPLSPRIFNVTTTKTPSMLLWSRYVRYPNFFPPRLRGISGGCPSGRVYSLRAHLISFSQEGTRYSTSSKLFFSLIYTGPASYCTRILSRLDLFGNSFLVFDSLLMLTVVFQQFFTGPQVCVLRDFFFPFKWR
jgi:hypothetical protein